MAKSFSLILTAPGNDPILYRLADERVSVGRSEDNRIVVEVKAVSSRHARFEKSSAGAYRIVDLGSTNGTRVNGQKVMNSAGVVLKHGDRLLFGETVEAQFLEVVDGTTANRPSAVRRAALPVSVSASEIENENAWIPVPNWLDPSADDLDMEEAINPVAAAVARQEGSAKAGRR
ncbi:MAG: FHA domain-containing protein [Verrucomicrobiae bacterium]|nr:FHA domain-containing protein [Verrucomicrobiae bacterium]